MSAAPNLASQADAALTSRFGRDGQPSHYISAYRTRHGRALVLEKERQQDIFLWAECFDARFDEVAINNRSFPGQPYHADQPRNSNLNASRASRLMRGNPAYYLKFPTLVSLERFLDWYAEIPA